MHLNITDITAIQNGRLRDKKSNKQSYNKYEWEIWQWLYANQLVVTG